MEYVKEYFGIRWFKDFKSCDIVSKTVIPINKLSLNIALCKHTDGNWQYKIPAFKEFKLIQQVRYRNHNLNKFAEYLCKVPNECYRQEVLLGFNKEKNYYLVAVKKEYIGKGRNLSRVEEIRGPIN